MASRPQSPPQPPKVCIICDSELRATRLECGHALACRECTQVLLNARNARCPTCRKPIRRACVGPCEDDGCPIIARQPTYDQLPSTSTISISSSESDSGATSKQQQSSRTINYNGGGATPEEWARLRQLFERATELGLTEEQSTFIMVGNVRNGRFTPQHYVRMWERRIAEAEERRETGAAPPPAMRSLTEGERTQLEAGLAQQRLERRALAAAGRDPWGSGGAWVDPMTRRQLTHYPGSVEGGVPGAGGRPALMRQAPYQAPQAHPNIIASIVNCIGRCTGVSDRLYGMWRG